jgi:hypothetical protein
VASRPQRLRNLHHVAAVHPARFHRKPDAFQQFAKTSSARRALERAFDERNRVMIGILQAEPDVSAQPVPNAFQRVERRVIINR